MIFWITLMVALLYGLLGMLKPELLILRFEETAIGSAIAVVVIMTLLPVRTREVLGEALAELLSAIAALVGQAEELGGADGAPALVSTAWQVAEKTNALRNSIGPLKRGWERLSPSAIRIAVGLAEDLAYAARELAYAVAMTTVSSAENTALCSKAKRLHGELEEYCKEIKSAGAKFRCNGAGPAKMEISPGCQGSDEPEPSVPFGNREALVDLMRREVARLRAICAGSRANRRPGADPDQ